jgi:hypothetical protein
MPKAYLFLLALFLFGGLHAAEPTGASAIVARLGETPGLARLTDDELQKYAQGAYAGEATFYLLPEGRYYYYLWSELGMKTRYYDTGAWKIRDGLIELTANPTNVVLKNNGRTFLLLKNTESRYFEAFAFEVGNEAERVVAEIERLRKKPKVYAAGQRESIPAALTSLAIRERPSWVFRRELASERYQAMHVPVFDGLNQLATTAPAAASPQIEFQQRARRFVPALTAAPRVTMRAVAGRYLGSAGVGSDELYLLPDGGYYFTHHSDLPGFTTGYDQGRWAVSDGVVILSGGGGAAKRTFEPDEKRFFVMRAPLSGDPRKTGPTFFNRFILIGATKEAGQFLIDAAKHEAAVLMDKKDPNSEQSRRYAMLVLLGTYNSMRLWEGLSVPEGKALRKKLEAEDQADAAAWEEEQKNRK